MEKRPRDPFEEFIMGQIGITRDAKNGQILAAVQADRPLLCPALGDHGTVSRASDSYGLDVGEASNKARRNGLEHVPLLETSKRTPQARSSAVFPWLS
jgi:hypothetical protein